jgi:hypothetical protein
MIWGGSRGRSVLALGFFLARRGVTAAIGLVLTLGCVAGFSGLALVFARRGRLLHMPSVPLLASSVLAFGVGILVAVAASSRVFRRDEDQGIRALLCARGVTTTGYVIARVAGIAAVLACLVGGGSALVGLVATLSAHGRQSALHTAQTSVAAVAFGVAFAVTFAPVALATLGARSRATGYLTLLAILIVPDLLEPTLRHVVAPAWIEVCSIPGALLALRASLGSSGGCSLFLRAIVALLVIIVVALVVVRAELLRHHGTSVQPGTGGRQS